MDEIIGIVPSSKYLGAIQKCSLMYRTAWRWAVQPTFSFQRYFKHHCRAKWMNESLLHKQNLAVVVNRNCCMWFTLHLYLRKPVHPWTQCWRTSEPHSRRSCCRSTRRSINSEWDVSSISCRFASTKWKQWLLTRRTTRRRQSRHSNSPLPVSPKNSCREYVSSFFVVILYLANHESSI